MPLASQEEQWYYRSDRTRGGNLRCNLVEVLYLHGFWYFFIGIAWWKWWNNWSTRSTCSLTDICVFFLSFFLPHSCCSLASGAVFAQPQLIRHARFMKSISEIPLPSIFCKFCISFPAITHYQTFRSIFSKITRPPHRIAGSRYAYSDRYFQRESFNLEHAESRSSAVGTRTVPTRNKQWARNKERSWRSGRQTVWGTYWGRIRQKGRWSIDLNTVGANVAIATKDSDDASWV